MWQGLRILGSHQHDKAAMVEVKTVEFFLKELTWLQTSNLNTVNTHLCTKPANTAISPSSSLQETFHQEERLWLSDRNSILMTNQCLPNKPGSHGVPNVNLFDFMFLLVDYGKFCDLLQMSDSKTPMIFVKKNIF